MKFPGDTSVRIVRSVYFNARLEWLDNLSCKLTEREK